MKGVRPGKLLAISRYYLTLGGVVPPESLRPQVPEHQEYSK